ncbi:MAG: DUF6503 family protein [Thermoanaerobaculia bacterium]
MSRRRVVVAGLCVFASVMQGWELAESVQVGSARLDVVDRAIEYHGGDRYLDNRTSLEVCSKSGCYEVSAAVQAGRYEYRVRGPYRGGVREALVSNDRVLHWQDDSEMYVSPEGDAALRDWAMARVYFCFLPYRLNDDSVLKEDLGPEKWSGRDLHKVKVTFVPGTSTDAGDEFLYWFDPATGRLEQFAYSFVGSPGGLRFRKLYNFRRIGGLLFFDQENWGAAGDGLTVEMINPDFVATMEKVSTVELRNIQVAGSDGAIN